MYQNNLALLPQSSPASEPASLNLYAGQLCTGPRRASGLSTLDRPHTRATLTLYPDGDAQITGAHYFPTKAKQAEPETPEEKQKRAAGRAKGKIHSICKFNNFDHLWTCGRRGGFETYQDTVRFIRRFKRLSGSTFVNFKAIFIPELHLGGGLNHGRYHVHFAVRGFYDVRDFREIVNKILGYDAEGKPQGSINVSSSRVQNGSHESVASYISGYVSKDIFEGKRQKHQRYYLITRNCILPNLQRPENKNIKFGIKPLGRDYKGRTEERESRLLGEIFLRTGRIARIVWKSDDGLNFRIATFGRSYAANQVSRQL